MFQQSDNADGALNAVPENDNDGAAVELDRDDVPPTDITFDCPHCGKNISIDPRGAGLVVKCPLCNEQVTVPIPEGLEVEDFDATPEELSLQLISARKKLARAEERILALNEQISELKKIEFAAKNREEEDEALFALLRAKLSELASHSANAASIATDISELITEE